MDIAYAESTVATFMRFMRIFFFALAIWLVYDTSYYPRDIGRERW